MRKFIVLFLFLFFLTSCSFGNTKASILEMKQSCDLLQSQVRTELEKENTLESINLLIDLFYSPKENSCVLYYSKTTNIFQSNESRDSFYLKNYFTNQEISNFSNTDNADVETLSFEGKRQEKFMAVLGELEKEPFFISENTKIFFDKKVQEKKAEFEKKLKEKQSNFLEENLKCTKLRPEIEKRIAKKEIDYPSSGNRSLESLFFSPKKQSCLYVEFRNNEREDGVTFSGRALFDILDDGPSSNPLDGCDEINDPLGKYFEIIRKTVSEEEARRQITGDCDDLSEKIETYYK